MFAFWELLEIAVAIAVAIFLLSQVVYPLFSKKPFFWILGGSEKRLAEKKKELAGLDTEEEVVDLREQVDEKRKRINERMAKGGEEKKAQPDNNQDDKEVTEETK